MEPALKGAARLLRSPDSGLPGQGVRFAAAGGFVAVLYLALTTTLARGLGVPFQIALVVGFATAVATHFALQRFFVWVHHRRFALAWHQQVRRYLVVAGLQYGVTAATTSVIPRVFGVPVTPVFLVTAALVSVLNFLIFRASVFHEDRPMTLARDEEVA